MSNRLMQILNAQITDINARKNFVTISTAIAVAYALPIPNDVSEPNPYAYFDNSLEETAKKLIMEINETAVLSVRDCLEMTRKLWTQRYNLIFNAGSVNPALLIALVGEKDPHSVGNEFLQFSETYRVSSPQVLNELSSFIQDIGDKCGLGTCNKVNIEPTVE